MNVRRVGGTDGRCPVNNWKADVPVAMSNGKCAGKWRAKRAALLVPWCFVPGEALLIFELAMECETEESLWYPG
jgi:hypothetical protein